MDSRRWFVVAILALGCERPDWKATRSEPDCVELVDRERVTKCAIDCATAANPKSDEEGEDLVAQCEITCVRLSCPRRNVRYWCPEGHSADSAYCRRAE